MKKTVFVVATNNAHKLTEIREILANVGCECVSLKEAGININIIESGKTFSENARIKARAVYDICKRPTIADDSGLCVDALDGAPGIFTARYAGAGCDSEKNMDKLLGELAGIPTQDRTARFVSAVCAILADGTECEAIGCVEGYIGTQPSGSGGFGYDPIFKLPNNVGIAEISERKKNAVSHRGRAIRKLAFKLRGIKKIRGIDFDK
ncbi:MAG: RdgB/HAM1 family non-canonical purine NTP pyrophosphatase [Oscillospiraceae bacterium]